MSNFEFKKSSSYLLKISNFSNNSQLTFNNLYLNKKLNNYFDEQKLKKTS